MSEVTDPRLLAALEEEEITDPALLAALNGGDPKPPLQSAGNPLTQMQIDQQTYDKTNFPQKMQLGLKQSALETVQGVSDLATGGSNYYATQLPENMPRSQTEPMVSPETTSELERLQNVRGGFKTAGNIAGDVAQLAIPTSRVAKMTNFPRALAAESGLVAGHQALQDPEPGQTRIGNAAIGGAATAVGGTAVPAALRYGVQPAVRQVLNKAAPIDSVAQEMIEGGVKLTPGMARPRLAGVERLMGKIPGVGGRVGNLQAEAVESWNKYVLERIGPIARDLDATGQEAFQTLQDRFTSAYSDVWGGVTPKNVRANEAYKNLDTLKADIDKLPTDYQGLARGSIEDAQTALLQFAETGDTRLLDAADDALRAAQQQAGQDGGPLFSNIRNVYRESLPDNVGSKLAEIDYQYRKYGVTQRAAGYVDSMKHGGVISPSSLLGAVKAKNSERAVSSGTGAFQNEAQAGQEVLSRTLPTRFDGGSDAVVELGTLGAAYAEPASTAAGISAGRQLVTPSMRDYLTQPGYMTPAPGTVSGIASGSGATNYTSDLINMLKDPNDPKERQRMLAELLRTRR